MTKQQIINNVKNFAKNNKQTFSDMVDAQIEARETVTKVEEINAYHWPTFAEANGVPAGYADLTDYLLEVEDISVEEWDEISDKWARYIDPVHRAEGFNFPAGFGYCPALHARAREGKAEHKAMRAVCDALDLPHSIIWGRNMKPLLEAFGALMQDVSYTAKLNAVTRHVRTMHASIKGGEVKLNA